jgi:hypothetical protein
MMMTSTSENSKELTRLEIEALKELLAEVRTLERTRLAAWVQAFDTTGLRPADIPRKIAQEILKLPPTFPFPRLLG